MVARGCSFTSCDPDAAFRYSPVFGCFGVAAGVVAVFIVELSAADVI